MTVRRLKTYAGGQGLVYQYYFVGERAASGGTEYVFDVSQDRKTYFSVTVFVETRAAVQWQAEHARELTNSERYASAKLRLFSAFDELKNMSQEGRSLTVDSSNLGELLDRVGID